MAAQPPRQQPPPSQPRQAGQQHEQREQQEVSAAVAAALLAALAATTLALAVRKAAKVLVPMGIDRRAVVYAVHIVWTSPAPDLLPVSAMQRRVLRREPLYRVMFVVNAAKRLTVAARDARSHGQPVNAAIAKAAAAERRYFAQHAAARDKRLQGATMLDAATELHGPVLGWRAVLGDGRTTRECAVAHGCNFDARAGTRIGWPGLGPHVGCRCRPVAPWPTKITVDQALTRAGI